MAFQYNHYYEIYNGGKYVNLNGDHENNVVNNGEKVTMYARTNNPDQRWALERYGSDYQVRILLTQDRSVAQTPHRGVCCLCKRELVGVKLRHLALCARPFCRSNIPLGCLLLMQTRTCRGTAPPSCYRKTVLSLESPTGAFIASLRFANANFIKSSPPGISDPTSPPNRRFPYKKTKKLIHPIMTALEDGFILKIPPIPDKTPHRGYNSFRPQ